MSALLPSRRAVVVGGGALGLLIGLGACKLPAKGPRLAGTSDSAGAFLHDWIHVGADGAVTIRAGQSEMGQGAFTGIATLVAEELGCRLDQFSVETGPASDAFKNIAVGRDVLSPERAFANGAGHEWDGCGAVTLTAAVSITGSDANAATRTMNALRR